MRALIAILFVSLLAGCFSDDTTTDNDTNPDTEPTPTGYVLDCTVSNWNESCLVWASPNDSPSKTEVDLVVNPLDPNNVVVASKDLDRTASNDCVWSVAQVSKDGGHNWTTSYVGGTIASREPGDMLYGFDCVTDPIMTFNKEGDLFYNLQAYRLDGEPPNPCDPILLGCLPGPDAALMAMAVSHDGGSTWAEYHAQQPGDWVAVIPDYMHMGTNPETGTVFAIWNNIVGLATSNPTVATKRTDEPVTQTTPIPSSSNPGGLGESGIVGLNDGTVIAWLGGFNSPNEAHYSISTDDGLTWGDTQFAFPFTPMDRLGNVSFRDGTSVELTADNSGGANDGCIYAAWGGKEGGVRGGSDIYVRSSCDKGTTWTDPVLVNTDNETRPGGQWMPRITVDARGTVHVVYLTQAYDMGGDDHDAYSWVDAEWAYSEDGGATWNTTRLTEHTFDGDLGIHQNGGAFLGDYIGIGSSGTHVYMGFPTTFTGRAEIAVAKVTYEEPAASI